jgi:hypothetical protein
MLLEKIGMKKTREEDKKDCVENNQRLCKECSGPLSQSCVDHYRYICNKCESRKPHVRFSRAKSQAKRKGITWNISTIKEYIELIEQPCFYCKNQLCERVETRAGLDRLDNSKGYKIGNVVSCGFFCNTLKNKTWSPTETKFMAELLILIRQPKPYNEEEYKKLFDAAMIAGKEDNFVILNKAPKHILNKEDHVENGHQCKDCGDQLNQSSIKNGSPICSNCYARKPHIRVTRAKSQAKWKGIPWNLTKKEHMELIEQLCYYCDGYFKKVETGIGLDRLDNSKGYQKENVVSCCYACNRTKLNILSPKEAKAVIGLGILMRRQRDIDEEILITTIKTEQLQNTLAMKKDDTIYYGAIDCYLFDNICKEGSTLKNLSIIFYESKDINQTKNNLLEFETKNIRNAIKNTIKKMTVYREEYSFSDLLKMTYSPKYIIKYNKGINGSEDFIIPLSKEKFHNENLEKYLVLG